MCNHGYAHEHLSHTEQATSGIPPCIDNRSNEGDDEDNNEHHRVGMGERIHNFESSNHLILLVSG